MFDREMAIKYKTFIEGTIDLVTQVDSKGKFIFINKQSERFMGLKPDKCIGMSAFETVHPDDREVTKEWFYKCINSRTETTTIQNRVITADGNSLNVHWSVNFHYDDNGKMTTAYSIARDVTPFIEAEKALQESLKQRADFISTAAHELRTPLTAVMGCSEILLRAYEYNVGEEQKVELAQTIFERSQVLSDSVDDLLDLSRAETGKAVNLKLEACRPSDLIEACVKAVAMHNGTHKITYIDKTMKLVALLDHHKFERVVANLIDNAIKYSPNNTPVNITLEANENSFTLIVEDKGIGMGKKTKARVFEKFFRADASNTAVGGLGIGLNIVQAIVVSHGGSVGVESKKGSGSKFIVTMPLKATVHPI